MFSKEVKKDICVLLATVFYSSLIKFATLVICYRFIPKEEVGLYIFATSLSFTLLIIGNLNINLVFVRQISRSPLSLQGEINSLLVIRIFTGIIFLSLLIALSLLLGYSKYMAHFLLIALFVLFDDIFVSFNYLFIAVKKVFYCVLIPVVTQTGFIILLIGLLKISKPAIEPVIFAQLIRSFVLLAAALLVTHAKISRLTLTLNKKKVIGLLRQTPPFILVALAFLSYGYIAIFWLGQLNDFFAVTHFGIALSVVNIFIIIPKVIISVIYPQASKSESKLGWRDFIRFSLFIFAFSLALVGIISKSAHLAFDMLLGASSREVIAILQQLVWILPGVFLSYFFVAMLQAKDKEKPAVRICLFWFCFYTVALPLAFIHFKIQGLTLTMVSVYLLQSFSLGLYAFKISRINIKAENAII